MSGDGRSVKVDAYEFTGLVDKIRDMLETDPAYGAIYRDTVLRQIIGVYAPSWVVAGVDRLFDVGADTGPVSEG